MPATSLPKNAVFHGARARLSIDEKPIGFATNCSGTEEIVYEAIKVMDNIQTVEHVAIDYNVSFQAGRVRLIGPNADVHGSLRGTLGVYPKLGATAADFLANILAMGEMTASIEDTVSQTTFMNLQQVKIASHNWAIGARGLVGEDISFVAVRMVDDAE